MNNTLKLILAIAGLSFVLGACEKEARNIAGDPAAPIPNPMNPAEPVVINPVDINEVGLGLLSHMQGQWVGYMNIIGDEYDAFAFDYRAISPSHTFGIYEGGSAGNLLTSFFVTDFKDTRTIMARNGGLLNGIYRTSYFVLDSARSDANGDYYRLVDAKGGDRVMFMELRFKTDSLYFNAYTSRLGLFDMSSRHMTYKAQRWDYELAQTAANDVGYPQNEVAWDFSQGFMEDYLYINAGADSAKSASFLSFEDGNTDVFDLAIAAGDPWTIAEHPYLGLLQVNVDRGEDITGAPLLLYLSKDALTDQFGYFSSVEAFGTILRFPDLSPNTDDFLITYLHPGSYHVTVIADMDGDGAPSEGDITHADRTITILPEGTHEINLTDINVVN